MITHQQDKILLYLPFCLKDRKPIPLIPFFIYKMVYLYCFVLAKSIEVVSQLFSIIAGYHIKIR
ncbi:hypothetical protein ES708_34536 [subsurface metagenome]